MKINQDNQYNNFITEINFLCSIKENNQNNKIITDYFFKKFSKSPKYFNRFILFIKENILKLDDDLKKKLAIKYLDILSFLCERFGLYKEKLILDDICFNIINPEEYNNMSLLLEKYKEKSKIIIEKINSIFNKKLKENDIQAIIKGRYKNIYSIYKKCKKNNNFNILKLNDIFAFRIILEDESENKCFDVLNILHNSFNPIPDRFKDYISIPKINGYQSLHTGLINVIADLDLIIEVQIRNIKMDEIAESGVAAHFLYGRNKKSTILNKKEVKLFEHITSTKDLSKEKNIIYSLTPKGDIIILEKNSTILDFANKIHTQLGKIAKQALVNGKNKKLSYKIKNFETIEILK